MGDESSPQRVLSVHVVLARAGSRSSSASSLARRADEVFHPSGGGKFTLDLQLEARPGVTVLFGPSGAGKSTALAMIAGLERPDSGRITLGTRVLLDRSSRVDVPPHERRIALVFQSIALFPHQRVIDNVAYGIRRRAPSPVGAEGRGAGRSSAARRALALAWLERTRVAHLASRWPRTLSGGEAQRVALARALASEPEALLLDEPFSSLDAELRDDLVAEVRRLVDDLTLPAILVTHDRDEALACGDAAVVVREGRVVASGTPKDVLGRRAAG